MFNFVAHTVANEPEKSKRYILDKKPAKCMDVKIILFWLV